jgi:segregation and condensation protein A
MNHDFDGPLDLLLDEVRRQKVAIEQIAMAPIVARYLEYMRAAAGRNWQLDIEWLHMAATLIQWKSRALLRQESREAETEDPVREELVQQLLTHHKEVAGELARRCAPEPVRPEQPRYEEPAGRNEPDEAAFVSVWDLMEQARELSRWAEQYATDQRRMRASLGIEADEIDTVQMTALLDAELRQSARGLDFTGLLMRQPTSAQRCFLFLGGLSLVHRQEAQVYQNETFGPIHLRLCAAAGEDGGTQHRDIEGPEGGF